MINYKAMVNVTTEKLFVLEFQQLSVFIFIRLGVTHLPYRNLQEASKLLSRITKH